MSVEGRDEEFQRRAVELLSDSGKGLRATARRLEVSPGELRQWRDEYLKGCPTSRFAVAGLVLGLIAVTVSYAAINDPGGVALRPLILLFSGCGLVTASIGVHQTNPNRARKRGNALAAIGFGLNFLLFVPLIVVTPHMFHGSHEPAFRASCQNNLKQMGIIFWMYANEHEGGAFPPLSSEPGRLMFDNKAGGGLPVYPEYFADLNVIFCPKDEDGTIVRDAYEEGPITGEALAEVLDDHSYFYLGYVVTSDAGVEAFAGAYRECIASGIPFSDDLSVPEGKGNAGTDTILRLREGVAERLLDGDSESEAVFQKQESEIPVLIERPDNHVPRGGNVLYLDGHVEFHKYPGAWPMTEKTMGLLESLDAMGEEN